MPSATFFRLGSALVELSQARQPCWKLNLRFGLPDMARRVQDSGRTGWYLRVLVPGSVAAGDRMTLTARPNPGWDLARVQRLLYRDAVDREALAEFAGLAGLSASWRALAMRRLKSGAFEDWAPRLSG
jgi:MOSC domain-containing protein YiiM